MELSQALSLLRHTNYTNFSERAREVFHFQSRANPQFLLFQRLTGFQPEWADQKGWFPFFPISFFKSQRVQSFEGTPEICFYSSSTSGKGPSEHRIKRVELYESSYYRGFQQVYGPPENYCFLCLLPAYAEREGSSLIYMAEDFVKQSHDPDSGFFLYNHEELYQVLLRKIEQQTPTILLGVSFALLDFAEKFSLPENHLIIMETGGMKGRRREMIRSELHEILTRAFGVSQIHSEYGMTELLSQAYSTGNGLFRCPPWMKVVVKEQDDPFSADLINKRGRICIIDLANVYSCSFIETEDLGIVYEDGSFEVLGRLDHSDIRGCNVMV